MAVQHIYWHSFEVYKFAIIHRLIRAELSYMFDSVQIELRKFN